MSGLTDAWRRFVTCFGQPSPFATGAEHDQAVDGRLTDLEREQLEIAARLRILEKAGNPRGIGRDY